jgi:hypothetical protein
MRHGCEVFNTLKSPAFFLRSAVVCYPTGIWMMEVAMPAILTASWSARLPPGATAVGINRWRASGDRVDDVLECLLKGV